MGIFDIFKKNNKVPTETQPVATQPSNEIKIDTEGFDAITKEFERIYPGQTNPKHFGTLINWKFGGNDPLEGISIYEDVDCWHFVTYGFSELYEKEFEDKEISGYGFELTFRLKKDNYENLESEIKCICGILQTIGRMSYTNGDVFKAYEYIYTGQKSGIDSKGQSNITGFITIPDVKAQTIHPKNGKVDFVELIGVTDNELQRIINKEITVANLYTSLSSDITDYNRQSKY